MKGISIQFQNLISHLRNNLNNTQTTSNRQSFEYVFQKVTFQCFKLISIIFEEVLEQKQARLSFNKLSKQLKQFLTHKPTMEDQQDDLYNNQQFDQLQQFMNSRKPLNDDTDSFQRGDIYKFLSQAQSKQKDMNDFIGNIGNNKGGFKDRQFKKSMKNLKSQNQQQIIQTVQIQVQTDFNYEMFKILQNKFPSLFRQPIKTKTIKLNQNSSQNNQEFSFQKQFLSRMNQIPSFKSSKSLQLLKKLSKNQQNLQNTIKQEQNKKDLLKKKNNNNNGSKKLIQTESKNKLGPISNKAASNSKGLKSTIKQSSSSNNKINNIQNSSTTNNNSKVKFDIKNKANNQVTDSIKKNSQQMKNLTSKINNVNGQPSISNISCSYQQQQQQKNFLANMSKFMPTMDELKNILVGLSDQQIAKVYEAMQKNLTENAQNPIFMIQTFQKQINTNQSSFNNQYSQGQQIKIAKMNKKKSNTTQYQQDQNSQGNFKKKTIRYTSINNEGQLQQNDQKQACSLKKNKSINRKNNKLDQNNLPSLNQENAQNILFNSQQASNSRNTTQSGIQPWKGKQNKYVNDLMNMKINKQSLQMNKSKKGLHRSKLGGNNGSFLPSIHKDSSQKGLSSVHQNQTQLLDFKNQNYSHMSYSQSANNLRNSMNNGSGFQVFNNNSSGFDNLLKKNGKLAKQSKQIGSTQQQRIMRQLQKISNSDNLRSNLNKVFMYVQFIESVHQRRCGNKCIHLQRFYQFLKKRNLPSRIQLFPHKNDMNVNIDL